MTIVAQPFPPMDRLVFMRSILLMCGMAWLVQDSCAQSREVVFTSFPADSVTHLTLEAPDSIVVRTWHNSAIFVESEIILSGCASHILRHTVENGRYALQARREGTRLSVVAQSNDRGGFNTPRGYCEEKVLHRIFIPADFAPDETGGWIRTEEKSRTTINY